MKARFIAGCNCCFFRRPGLAVAVSPVDFAYPLRDTSTYPTDEPAPSPGEIARRARRHRVAGSRRADHFDPVALKQALSDDGKVFALASMAASVAAKGLAVVGLDLWEPASAGDYDGHDFLVVPVAAADGFGDTQVAWVVRVAGRRFIHCGDTIWHGHWHQIARAYGPFDIAFLPINGFTQTDIVPQSDEPYALTPERALQAARLLGASLVVPIHFGRGPSPTYIETDEPQRRFLAEARRLGQAVRVMRAGETLRMARLS